MNRRHTRVSLLLPAIFALGLSARADDGPKTNLPLLFQEDFAQGADRWEPTDRKAWKVVKTDKKHVYNSSKTASTNHPTAARSIFP